MLNNMEQIATKAKEASLVLAGLSTQIKNDALEAIANALIKSKAYIMTQNEEDLKKAKVLLEKGEISQAIYDRLKLSDAKFNDVISGVLDVKKLQDPVNQTLCGTKLDEGLELYKVSCPIGVIGVIFEYAPLGTVHAPLSTARGARLQTRRRSTVRSPPSRSTR